MTPSSSGLPQLFDAVQRASSVQAQVGNRVRAAETEAARLQAMASDSGALPGEFKLTWRYRRGRGAWPTL